MEAVALFNKSLKMLKAFTFLQPVVDSTPEVKDHKRKEKLAVLERDPEDDVIMEAETKNIQDEIEEFLEGDNGPEEVAKETENEPKLEPEPTKTESTPESISTQRTRRNRVVIQLLPGKLPRNLP